MNEERKINVGDTVTLTGKVTHVYEDGGVNVLFNGSLGTSVVHPEALAHAIIEPAPLKGQEAAKAWANMDWEKEKMAAHLPGGEWFCMSPGDTLGVFLDPDYEFRVVPK